MVQAILHMDPSDKTSRQLQEGLAALEDLWLEKLQPYEERGYHSRPLKS